jgi:hypothetical protein
LVKVEPLQGDSEMLFEDQVVVGYFQTEGTTSICSIVEDEGFADSALVLYRK